MDTDKEFNEWQMKSLKEMMDITKQSIVQMSHVLNGRREESSLRESINLEIEINAKRDQLKAENVNAINEHQYDHAVGTLFADLVNECEKLADYVINVVEARLK
jgi:phosphate:Na+ symporter